MGCLGGCLSKCFWTIVIVLVWVIAWIVWLLNWVCWAVFKILYLLLFILCLFCSNPPAPATVNSADVIGKNGEVNQQVMDKLIEDVKAGDIGSMYLMAQKTQEYVEQDDWDTTLNSMVTGLPEELLRENAAKKDEASRMAEDLYGIVADQGYMLARYKKWGMVLSRWERKLDYWCWIVDICWKTLEKEKL